ncbi:WecB/TagA/CpsF family glycosyltransferase [Photobacterium damselae]|uniref:WecB/TagA/CpsF family glycosyltransferase n=1 Tax=Photobacterium damselae TaxID=38293 RepID=UPI0020913F4C|nr:WecB/TagA/CpsF family glycosyltransferase [Photobacterium damselae]USR76602.1 WecB/TagA/CpsF family glycosyltransferase [Photobacterium damselae]
MYCKKLEDKLTNFDGIESVIQSKPGCLISFVNPFSYPIISKDLDLINNIDYWFSDGFILCKLITFFDKRKLNRYSFDFSSIAHEVFKYIEKENLNLAIIGANKNEIENAIDYIKSIYDINVGYFSDGYFDLENNAHDQNLIDNNIDVLIVGMGTPYQEKFMIDINKKVNLVFSISCGGFLTQTALKGDYYHPIVKKLGLRWLQRAIMHQHVRERLIKDYPYFLLKYIYTRTFNKNY